VAETVDTGPAVREERRPITALFADVVARRRSRKVSTTPR